MSNLRGVIAVAAVIGLVSSNFAVADPLAAGKPAGVRQAQSDSGPILAWIGLAGVAAAGIAAAAVSGSSPSSFTTVPVSTGTTS